MPGRVAKIEDVTRQLQQGSLKLRVRDPASERAMRRSGIMQAKPSPCRQPGKAMLAGLCLLAHLEKGFSPVLWLLSWEAFRVLSQLLRDRRMI